MEKGKPKAVSQQPTEPHELDASPVDSLKVLADNEAQPPPKPSTRKARTWWDDLYTDAAGNCFSDADPGL